MIKRIFLIISSRYFETKKNINLFSEVYFKPKEKLSRLIYSLIYAKQPKFLNEEYKSFGNKNKDVNFFVVRLTIGAGLYSNYINALYMIYYARKFNLEPIIDYQNYPSYQREKKGINGIKNSWNYFFNQPTKYSLKEVYSSKNVVLSDNNSKIYFDRLDFKDFYNLEVLSQESQLKELNEISNSIKYNLSTQKYIDNNLSKIFENKMNVIGIAVRGTDYNIKNFGKNHHKPFTSEEAIKKIKDVLGPDKEFDHVFICTEEQEILDNFKKEFGERLLFTERPRHSKENYDYTKNVMSQKFNRKHDRYLSNLEYILEVEGLLRCDKVIGTFTNALYYISIKNSEKNNDVEVFNYGIS